MNVREEILRKKIDPTLTRERLQAIAELAFAEDSGLRPAESADIRDKPPVPQTVEVLSGGCWNRVVALSFSDGRPALVCKISPEDRDGKLLREYRVLGYFASHTAMPVPRPLLVDCSTQLVPGTLLVMTRIPGVVLHRVFGLFDRPMAERVIDQIAAQVIELHGVRSRGFGGVELPEQQRERTWADFWLPRFDGVLEEVRASGQVAAHSLDRIERVRPRFRAALDVGERSTLTHYDIWSGNVIVDFEGSGYPGQPFVRGYIDIPGYYADYARELSFMEMFGLANRRFYDRYFNAHPQDEGFQLRKSIYNLKMHLKHITMYPGERYYRQGAEEALGHIESVL